MVKAAETRGWTTATGGDTVKMNYGFRALPHQLTGAGGVPRQGAARRVVFANSTETWRPKRLWHGRDLAMASMPGACVGLRRSRVIGLGSAAQGP